MPSSVNSSIDTDGFDEEVASMLFSHTTAMYPCWLKQSAGHLAKTSFAPSLLIGAAKDRTRAPLLTLNTQQRSRDIDAHRFKALLTATPFIGAPEWPPNRSLGRSGRNCDDMKRHSVALPSQLPIMVTSPPTPPWPAALPIGSMAMADIRAPWTAGIMVSVLILPVPVTSCKQSPPLPSPSLATSISVRDANMVLDIATTAHWSRVMPFLMALALVDPGGAYARRGTALKGGRSR
mmetsp:Transcript_16404/g.32993  ORF Transcript_16404/g.32993 Transcript_16404/m.32993 type:complete len:235 (-) Transcript_16404:591-1295(-)